MGIVRFALHWPHSFYVVALLILFPGVTAFRSMGRQTFSPKPGRPETPALVAGNYPYLPGFTRAEAPATQICEGAVAKGGVILLDQTCLHPETTAFQPGRRAGTADASFRLPASAASASASASPEVGMAAISAGSSRVGGAIGGFLEASGERRLWWLAGKVKRSGCLSHISLAALGPESNRYVDSTRIVPASALRVNRLWLAVTMCA